MKMGQKKVGKRSERGKTNGQPDCFLLQLCQLQAKRRQREKRKKKTRRRRQQSSVAGNRRIVEKGGKFLLKHTPLPLQRKEQVFSYSLWKNVSLFLSLRFAASTINVRVVQLHSTSRLVLNTRTTAAAKRNRFCHLRYQIQRKKKRERERANKKNIHSLQCH